VGGMGQGSNYAAGKGVQTMPTKVEFVTGTGLRSNYAAGKNALIKPKKEEFVLGMEQNPSDAARRKGCTKQARSKGLCRRLGNKPLNGDGHR